MVIKTTFIFLQILLTGPFSSWTALASIIMFYAQFLYINLKSSDLRNRFRKKKKQSDQSFSVNVPPT